MPEMSPAAQVWAQRVLRHEAGGRTEQGLIVRQSLRDARGTGAVTAELGAGAGWRPIPD